MQGGNQFWNNFVKRYPGREEILFVLMEKMAEGQGLEPRFTGPEPVVLPLDDPSV